MKILQYFSFVKSLMVDRYVGSKTLYDWPIKIRRAENTVLISEYTILKQRFDYIMTKPNSSRLEHILTFDLTVFDLKC